MTTLAFIIALLWQTPDVANGWSLFAKVEFESKYFEEEENYFLVPKFGREFKSLEGKWVQLKGFYMPFDLPGNALIISRNPFSSCFFCGGAGPETVAEVTLKSRAPRLKTDEVITVRGKLKLNATDVNHMSFQLIDAEIID